MFMGMVITGGERKELLVVPQTYNPYQRHEPTFTGEEPRTGHQPQFHPYHLQNLEKTLSQ